MCFISSLRLFISSFCGVLSSLGANDINVAGEEKSSFSELVVGDEMLTFGWLLVKQLTSFW